MFVCVRVSVCVCIKTRARVHAHTLIAVSLGGETKEVKPARSGSELSCKRLVLLSERRHAGLVLRTCPQPVEKNSQKKRGKKIKKVKNIKI